MEIKELLQGLKEQLDMFDAIDEYKESCTTLYLYHAIKKITELEEDKQRLIEGISYPVMGFGKVSVGRCEAQDENKTQGIIYLDSGVTRPLNEDTSDIFPIGSEAPKDKVLACVYFATPESVQQTINILSELLSEMKKGE